MNNTILGQDMAKRETRPPIQSKDIHKPSKDEPKAEPRDLTTSPSPTINLHNDKKSHNDNPTTTKDDTTKKETNIFKRVWNNPKKLNIGISIANASLHGLAAVTAVIPGMKTISSVFDKTALAFTRYIAPLVSYVMAAVKSFSSKKIIEGLIKLVSPVFLPFLSDSNIDAAYGTGGGLNVLYDEVSKRIENKKAQSEEYAEKLATAQKSASAYNKLIISEFKELWGEFFKGKLDLEATLGMISGTLMFAGGAPMLTFIRKARDTVAARTLGFIRNLGGGIGDIGFMLDKKDPLRRRTGQLCLTASITDILKRWVPEKWAKLFIHLSSAFNVSGYALWNARSATRQHI